MIEIDQAFGQAIRKYRLNLNLSQEDLAFRAGVHRTYISQIERGLKSPTLKVIWVLAKALEISMQELLHETETSLEQE
jgi:transcriptional regulator with XRE-family HTH domain